MNAEQLSQGLYGLTHGWSGFIVGYVTVAVFSLAGLKKGRAAGKQYLAWPLTSLATLVVVCLVMTVIWEVSLHFKVTYAPYSQLLISLIALMTGGGLGGLFWSTRGPQLQAQHARGAVVLDGDRAQKDTARRAKTARGLKPLTVAGVGLTYEDEAKHFKFMGTTGSGKSTVMRELLDGALKRGDRAVIADPDGAYLSRFYDPARGDVILNPFDARSVKWDLFKEIEKPYDIDQLARAMIADKAQGDSSWTSYGRTLFSALVKQTRALDTGTPAELYRLVTTASREELKLIIGGTPAEPFLDTGNDRFFGSVRATTADHVRCLEYICAQRGRVFSVRDWIRAGKGVLFLPYQAEQIAALKSVISTWMRLAIFQTLSLAEADHRIWFAVDELDALGAIDGLSDALPRLRKYGGRCALGFQSIAQVSTTYGQGAHDPSAGRLLISISCPDHS